MLDVRKASADHDSRAAPPARRRRRQDVNDTKWEQYGAIGGLVFVLLVVVSAFIAGSPPEPDDTPRKIAEYFLDNSGRIKAGSYLGALAIPAFLWFLGSIWSRIRRVEDARRLATIAAGGGIVAATLATAGGAVTATTALLTREIGLGAKVFYVLSGALGASAGFGAAVFTAAISIAAIRNGAFPEWLGYAGVAIAVGWIVAGLSLVTLSSGVFFIVFVVFLVWLVWLLAISFFLYRPQTQVAAPMP
jgi:hypothetical protein